MSWRYVLRNVGLLVLFLAFAMILPLCFSLLYGDSSFTPLLKSFFLTIVVGITFYISFKHVRFNTISQREGIAIVSLGWITVSFLGALPFYFSSHQFTFVNAFFESVSGFTTTGATILLDIEKQPKGLLLWRSFIQWLGGMGIIVLSIAILPFMKGDSSKLYKAEVPNPVHDKLKPKIRDTALTIWKFYITFTIIELILLVIGGMSFFDGLCHAFTTISSGGFSTMNTSIQYFDSWYIDFIIIIFMIFAGINFSLHYKMFKGKTFIFWRDSEFRFFLMLCAILVIVITFNVNSKVYRNILESFRYSLFQVVSIITTTGFITADYNLWPPISKMLIMLCMFIGASAGSTSGGMKCFRILLCLKYCYKEIFSVIHPRSIQSIKIGEKLVHENTIRSVFGFIIMYLILFILSSILLVGMGIDCISAVSAAATSIGNVGPGFGIIGPTNNYLLIPSCGKWLLAWCMLLGRLEIYTLIVLIVPEFWRK